MFSEGSTFHEKLKTSEALLMLGTNEMIDIDQMVNLVPGKESISQEKLPFAPAQSQSNRNAKTIIPID
ncbi:MAG: hypothetical protein H6640_16670 [Caldilineaceae bacterium]|nr:hypothetical protein [Caldilineaceae bacterium]